MEPMLVAVKEKFGDAGAAAASDGLQAAGKVAGAHP
jgi:hypothetical protein